MTEQERLRQDVARLVEALSEALDVCRAALDPPAADFEEEEARAFREEERTREALADVMAILDGALFDTRSGGLLLEGDE
jgi:hypothetical protein